jgi:hypothetical protein
MNWIKNLDAIINGDSILRIFLREKVPVNLNQIDNEFFALKVAVMQYLSQFQ